jgi:hypothetical protein
MKMTPPTDFQVNRRIKSRLPWLTEFVSEAALADLSERIRVRRITGSLLGERPVEEDGTEASGYCQSITITMVADDGSLIDKVQVGRYSWETNRSQRGETIGDALARQDDPDRIAWLVWYEWHSASHAGNEWSSLTLYRPPRDWSLSEWINVQQTRADAIAVNLVD